MTSKAFVLAAALAYGYLTLVIGYDMADSDTQKLSTEATQ